MAVIIFVPISPRKGQPHYMSWESDIFMDVAVLSEQICIRSANDLGKFSLSLFPHIVLLRDRNTLSGIFFFVSCPCRAATRCLVCSVTPCELKDKCGDYPSVICLRTTAKTFFARLLALKSRILLSQSLSRNPMQPVPYNCCLLTAAHNGQLLSRASEGRWRPVHPEKLAE